MIDREQVFLAKAQESLAGAESEFVAGRYNNCANRCYYACFQAAIHALVQVGIHPSGRRRQWGHDFVQAEFVGKLINRRKVYSTDLRKTLAETLALRETADYTGSRRDVKIWSRKRMNESSMPLSSYRTLLGRLSQERFLRYILAVIQTGCTWRQWLTLKILMTC